MRINGPGEITSNESGGGPDDGFPRLLRTAALIAVVAGAVGSLGLMLGAGRNTPRLLLALFLVWVLAPFVALAWASMASKRWPVPTRATRYCVALVIALVSLALYGNVVLPLAGSPGAFGYVVVPPGACLLMAIVVPIAALLSRGRSR